VICPTSRSAFAASFHPEVMVADQATQVLCEMFGAVDADALGERVGHLTREELRTVEDALLLVLDLV
jgi:mRNA interferase MazF